MVVEDVFEDTKDIDIAMSKEYYESINWNEKKSPYGVLKYYDVFELNYNPSETININGYYFMNLKDNLKLKKERNREKDKEAIKRLKKY